MALAMVDEQDSEAAASLLDGRQVASNARPTSPMDVYQNCTKGFQGHFFRVPGLLNFPCENAGNAEERT